MTTPTDTLLQSSLTIAAEFRRVWPWLRDSLEYGAYVHNGVVYPTHSEGDVWERVFTGKAQLWTGETAAIVSEIINSPTGLRTQNNWIAGGDIDEIKELMLRVERWGYLQGCHREVGNGRKGWLRAFEGYTEFGWRKQKDLLRSDEAVCLHR